MPAADAERMDSILAEIEAIINGARGLIFFGGNLPHAWTPEDARLGWNWSFWNRALRPVVPGRGRPLVPASSARFGESRGRAAPAGRGL